MNQTNSVSTICQDGHQDCSNENCSDCGKSVCSLYFKNIGRTWCINCDIFLYSHEKHYQPYVHCTYCGNNLVPIGDDRANGKDHPDWDTRTLHKKCWIEWSRSQGHIK